MTEKKEGGAAPTKTSKAADDAAEARGNEPGGDVTSLDQGEAGPEVADVTGTVSNRVEGTQQREPKPEELPTDALVSPVAEQLGPNNKLSVGHLTKENSGLDLPGMDQEPDRNLKSDMSKVELPEGSQQGDVAERVEEEAKARPENATREVRSRG